MAILKFLKNKLRRTDILAIALFTLVTIFYGIATAPGLTGSANVDTQVYNLGGKILAEGGTLYRDFFDHKGPAIHLLNELGYRLGGAEWGIWLIDLLLVLFAMIVLYRGFKIRLGALAATFVSAIIFFYYNHYLENKPEFYYLVAMSISLGLILRSNDEKSALASGVLASTVFFMKQTLIGYFVALFAYYLLSAKSSRRQLICYCGAGVLTAMGFISYLLAKGVFAEYYDCCFRFNVLYSNENPLFGNAFDFQNLADGLIAFGWSVGSPGILATFLAGMILITRRKFRLFGLALVFWLWEAFFVLRTGRFYLYQFVGLSFASSIAYIVLFDFIRTVRPDLKKLLNLVLCAMIGYSFSNMLFDENLKRAISCLTGHVDQESQADRKLVERVKALPDGPLLVWGSKCSLYYQTGRSGLSRCYYRTPLDLYGGISDNEADTIIRDISRCDDMIIVDSASEPILDPIPNVGKDRYRRESYFRRSLRDLVNREFKAIDSTVPRVKIFVKQK